MALGLIQPLTEMSVCVHVVDDLTAIHEPVV
jgi:hypothetical protein